MNAAYQILRQHFPEISSFRDIQEKAIDRALKKNTLCLMPTGGGKSLIYQIAGLLTKKATIVISPLIALMEQQYLRLKNKGLNCIFLHGGIGSKQQFSVMKDLYHSIDDYSFIFVSPERLFYDGYFEHILFKRNDKIGLIVIDEAHCISQWGHSFRPTYMSIPYFLDTVFGNQNWPNILCLTATLNPKDLEEICEEFQISSSDILKSEYLLRTNLDLNFEIYENEIEKLIRLESLLNQFKNEKVIVYTHRKKGKYGTKILSKEFKQKGFICERFDADCSKAHKDMCLREFENGKLKIIFATNAFGMGVDIPDIRVIIHYLLPESIEQYYQEIGRAGRDEKKSSTYLLYSPTNLKVRKDMIRKNLPNQNAILKIYNNKFQIKEGHDFSMINPWVDTTEDNMEMVIFNYLLRNGVFKIKTKGLGLINCFKTKKNYNNPLFQTYVSSSRTGAIKAISRKSNISINKIITELYSWYTDNQLMFQSSPTKVLYYNQSKNLDDNILDQISDELEERKKYRADNFDKFIKLIDSAYKREVSPEDLICEHLNISR
jgi:ATP-dependent DNA helicase RecQ